MNPVDSNFMSRPIVDNIQSLIVLGVILAGAVTAWLGNQSAWMLFVGLASHRGVIIAYLILNAEMSYRTWLHITVFIEFALIGAYLFYRSRKHAVDA